MRGSGLGSTVHRHHEEVDRHSKMVLMLQPVAVVGAAGGLVAGALLSLGWQAALKPLTGEVMLRTDFLLMGVPVGVELAQSSERAAVMVLFLLRGLAFLPWSLKWMVIFHQVAEA